MTVAGLIELLEDMPRHMAVAVFLDPEMFPHEVDLNELPGWYAVNGLTLDNNEGNVVAIQLSF